MRNGSSCLGHRATASTVHRKLRRTRESRSSSTNPNSLARIVRRTAPFDTNGGRYRRKMPGNGGVVTTKEALYAAYNLIQVGFAKDEGSTPLRLQRSWSCR